MIHVNVKGRYATAQATEPITAGSVGMPVSFRFTNDWEGLGKVAVFRGSGDDYGIVLVNNSCEVPHEALESAGGHLHIGVYGSIEEDGETVKATPTVWADAGVIHEGAEPDPIPDTPATAAILDQVLAAVEAAQAAAENGPYIGEDGYWYTWDPENGYYVNTYVKAEGNDGDRGATIWRASNPPVASGGGYHYSRQDLYPSSGTPKANDLVFSSSSSSIWVVTIGIGIPVSYVGSIKGADGEDGAPGVGVPTGGTTGQYLKKASDDDYDTEWASGGGGGTSDYDELDNRPQINSVTLTGNKALSDLGIAAASAVPAAATATPADLGTAAVGSSTKYAKEDHVHKKPTYSKSDVGLGNVDNVQQYSANNPPPYPVTSVNGSTGAVSLTIPSTAGDVGAIPAPASPSSGDVLTYSGSAWAASAPHYVPAGGNAGSVLAKNSATDYSLYWKTISDYTAAGIIITAAATAAKVCQYSFWDDTHYPQVLYVTLASANTAASALTLKVNGKGPYPVYINGTASSATNYTLPAGSYAVYFDGTNFYFQTDGKIPSAATDPQEVTISTAGAVTQALDAGKIYHFTGALTSLTITLNAAGTGVIPQYHFDFDSGSTAPTVTLPGTVTMQGGTFTPAASKHYEIDILNGYGVSVEW